MPNASTNVSLIRPGIMVGLKTSVEGGVLYERVDLNSEGVVDSFVVAEEGSLITSWQTTKVITDPEEFERATKVRNAARTMILRVCSTTGFGLLCPDSYESELNDAITNAKQLVKEHNATARCTRVRVNVLLARIASTDEAASRAIAEEVRELIEEMSDSIDKLDAEAIREAALKAKAMTTMLAPEQSEKVGLAIEAARKAARTITHRIDKKGEEAAKVLKEIQSQMGAIESARFAFLDVSTDDGLSNVQNENAMPGVELNRFDLEIGNEEEAK